MAVVVAAKEAWTVRLPLSVVFEMSHPFGPIFRLHAAGLGPGTGGVELAMPLQGPQFLEADLSRGPIHEETVYRAIMPVDTDVVRSSVREGVIIWWRFGLVPAYGTENAIAEHRYVGCPFDVAGGPAALIRP